MKPERKVFENQHIALFGIVLLELFFFEFVFSASGEEKLCTTSGRDAGALCTGFIGECNKSLQESRDRPIFASNYYVHNIGKPSTGRYIYFCIFCSGLQLRFFNL